MSADLRVPAVGDPAPVPGTGASAGSGHAPTPALPRPARRRRRSGTITRYVVLVVMLVVLAGPLLWQLSLSLKGPGDDLYAQPPQLLPTDPTLSNFTDVIARIPVLAFVLNSFVVAAIVIIGNLVLATAAGFALARLRWRLRPVATGVFVAAMLVPLEAIIIAQFLLVRSMGLTDTLLGVALPMLVTPLNVLLMRNAFLGIPEEIEEAAVVDGANAWQRFLRICMPQVKGVMSVVAIFAFVGSWNDFLWPLIILTSEDNYTLTVGLNYLRGTFYDDPRLIAAGTIIALVPIIALFVAMQRYFMRGLEQGGIKG
ncbi:carbohydrate ABC transporter permease [Brachybacterium sp. DNPG3]